MSEHQTKGVVLAGGRGTRLNPITKVINKHLLPIYDKPMIFYPIETLIRTGIKDIMVVSNEEYIDTFQEILKGSDFQCSLSFGIQQGFGGIADALKASKEFGQGSKVAVILGDNIYEDNFSEEINYFKNEQEGAHIFLKECEDAHRFGVAELGENQKVINIEEKPKEAKTNFAVTGFYLYDEKVYDIIDHIKPSDRGELEITDVNNWYINNCQMRAEFVKGEWIDAGTFESLYNASRIARKIHGKKD